MRLFPRVRLALLLFLLALALVPGARAAMDVAPEEVRLEPGATVAFELSLVNEGRAPLRFELRTHDAGLRVWLQHVEGELPPRSMARIQGSISAPWWAAAGAREVEIVLYADGKKLGAEDIGVEVAPAAARQLALLAGGFGTGALVVGVPFWRRWHLLGFALYSRIRREQVERHPTRARLVALAREEPGLTLAQLQARAALANGPFEHHLRKLVASGILVVEERGRSRLVRLRGAPPVEGAPDTATQVAALVQARREVRAAEIAREMGLSRQALHYHVRKLAATGAIDVGFQGGRLVLRAR